MTEPFLYDYDNNKEPLIICINGGLGNQLFMIFAGISKAMDERRNFCIYYKKCVSNDLYRRPDYFSNILKKIEGNSVVYDVNLVKNTETDHNNIIGSFKEIRDNAIAIYGYFQNFKYSLHNRDKIIKCLGFDNYLNSHKFPFKTIGLHFRFDDNYNFGLHNIVSKPSYYVIAIKKLQELLKERGDNNDYRYVIFSTQHDNAVVDNYINEINKNLETPIPFIKSYDYLNHNIDYEEFFYLSNCDHSILCQISTFCLFANYLTYDLDGKDGKDDKDGKDKKIVMYPDLWDGYDKPSTTRYFFDDWIRIYE